MAVEKSEAEVKAPVTGAETKDVRFPEDELAAIEKKASEDAAAQTKAR